MKVTAKTYIEVEIGVTGTFQRGYAAAGPTYSSGGEPGEADGFEDIEIVRFGALKRELSPPEILGSHPFTHRFIDLLDGIDPKRAAYQQLLANVLKFCGEDAELALLGEVGE